MANIFVNATQARANTRNNVVIHGEIKTIESNFTQQQKLNSLKKGEAHMYNKELYEQSKYYKKLIDVVKK